MMRINSGDLNTNYFHGMVRTRNSRSTITSQVAEDGRILEGIDEIGKEAVDFYKNLLGMANSSLKHVTVGTFQKLLFHHLPEESSLCEAIFAGKITSVIKKMKRSKAPGPDGFPAEFFQDNWSLVGPVTIKAIMEFFDTGTLRREVNCTILTLIPKVPNAGFIKYFRPISCCNFIYKCISKILVNRLKEVLPQLISSNQTASIKGRLITDNIILAHEMVKWYKRKNVSSRCALKIDIMKTFDNVDWGFLVTVMLAMGLPEKGIKWVQCCLESTTFSVCINGGLTGNFPAKKGLRQGCPLSPYLFAISMEVLSCMLNRATARNVLPYQPQCLRIGLTHLCFVDDLLIFTKGSGEAVGTVATILEKFYLVSGLRCNPSKSEFFCAGVTEEERGLLASCSRFKEGALPVRYLGIPLTAGKLKAAECRALVERITSRTRGWQAKLLTYADKLQLIVAVLANITQFWMNIIQLPKKVIREVESLCSKFLWGNLEQRKKAKVAWKHVALPKEEGGLGFRDLWSWNQACLARHIWAVLADQETLWIAWLKEYML
ncbi:unnamed protein product [Linum trigynum]|uniref:Reverse transcriptase domain-containing protein n=1 Tax=Linum trigynum TaxID=586398 RepID=A0AAV2FQN8_9ROSI